MSILSAVATIMEAAAAALRRADRPSWGSALAAPFRALRGVVAPPRPVGFWRCTNSRFDDFVVGMTYQCRAQKGTSCMRIHPHPGSWWAPYWQPEKGRFCYAEEDLDFVYLGPTLPAGATIDMRTEQDRTAARMAAQGMALAA